jgi:hypothetical protein
MSKLATTPQATAKTETAASALPRITQEARCYAAKELARRAGVTKEFFQQWTIDVTLARTTISFGPELHGKIHFPHRMANSVRTGIPVAKASWPHGTNHEPATELLLPFCEPQADVDGPLYRPTSIGELTCQHDVLGSLLFTLSRVEETICATLDEHGRFLSSASVAVDHDFLERPILDEHGLAFQQAVSAVLPRWQPQPRLFQLKLSHDIDDVGIPFGFRTAVAHTLKRHKPAATCRDLVSSLTTVEPAELFEVRKLASISGSRCLHSAFYWKASAPGPRDSGYDPKHPKIQQAIRFLKENGCELGVHPGYETLNNPARLAEEVARLRDAAGVQVLGGRQHYLRWNPNTWRDWEACGLHYDSSVGFVERFGFRAGTALPYRPWCFKGNRELNLIEVPLLLMDCTPVKYLRLSRQAAFERIQALIQRMKWYGGVFTLLWHNTPLLDPDYAGWYESLLDLLSGAGQYGVPPSCEQLW